MATRSRSGKRKPHVWRFICKMSLVQRTRLNDFYLILNAIRHEDKRLRRAQRYDFLCNLQRKRFRCETIQFIHTRSKGYVQVHQRRGSVSGHKTETMFYKYVKLSLDEYADNVASAAVDGLF